MGKSGNDKMNKGLELFSESLAAMLYTDEEIRATMSPEDAEEFIALRNEMLPPCSEVVLGRYHEDDIETPLAAEDDALYEK